MKLEDLTPNAVVRGLLPDGPATVVSVQWHGSDALAGLVGAEVRVTLEIEAEIPSGAPEQVVRTVTENSTTLKFISHGFEKE